MRKGEGKAQQIRGHKRHAKVLKRAKNKSLIKNNNAGQIYFNHLVDDEVRRLNNEKISTENKIVASQVNSVKPQVHRRKSGSA